jgi:hypothetical protein
MKKVYKIITYSVFLLIKNMSGIYSETVLEDLWKKSRLCSTDIQTADIYMRESESSLQHTNDEYASTMSTSFSSSFNDTYGSILWYPSYADGGIVWSKTLPGSLSLSTKMGYELNRSLLNIFEDGIPENTGYCQKPFLSFTLSQGLCPYWIQGYTKDPYRAQLAYLLEQKEQNYNQTIKSIIMAVTMYYIQLRKYERLIRMTEKTIGVYDTLIDSLTKSYEQGNIEISKVWEQENSRWEYVDDLNGYYDSRETALKYICIYCGDNSGIDYFSELPSCNVSLFDYDPQEKMTEAQILQLEAQHALDKQSNAPSVSLGGSFTDTAETVSIDDFIDALKEKGVLEWSVTASVNFSPSVSSKKKLLDEKYRLNRRVYELALQEECEENEKSCAYYDKMISVCKLQIEKAGHMEVDRLTFYNDAKKRLVQGTCTRMDVLQAESQHFTAKCIEENAEDALWYYCWMRNQIK